MPAGSRAPATRIPPRRILAPRATARRVPATRARPPHGTPVRDAAGAVALDSTAARTTASTGPAVPARTAAETRVAHGPHDSTCFSRDQASGSAAEPDAYCAAS
ncbi:hypothetical protein ACFYWY_03420 [Streptomyces sp. NPDC002870]|uniref:hypothetical protein n=1 Tax=Streptomyces sp. NPDC002870 TaxID=3364666 RepID=UPI00369E4584